MKSYTWLIRLYPPAWRARYGEEYAALLAECTLTWRDYMDMLFGALDAHFLAPAATPIGEGVLHMVQRVRRAEIAVFGAYIAFVVVGLKFYGQVDDSPFSTRTPAGSPFNFDLNLGHPLSIAWDVLAAGSLFALWAVLVGGVPIAFAVWRRSPPLRRLFIVPIVAFFAILLPPGVALILYATNQSARTASSPTLSAALVIAYSLYFIAAAIVSTLAVTRAVARGDIPAPTFRFALLPAAVATAAMALMTGSVFAWGIFAQQQAPAVFDTLNPLAGNPTLGSWLLDLAMMLVATIIAATSTFRGFRAQGAVASDIAAG